MMITTSFIEGFQQIVEVLKSCETEEQFNNTKEWALHYIEGERKYQREKCCFLFKKKVDEAYDAFYFTILLYDRDKKINTI
jgi:hypothetical protein